MCIPQGVPVANKYQISSAFNILYHRYQDQLEYQMFIAFQVKIHVFGSIINFPVDW